MEASHNADPREALRPGRDGGLRTVCLARLGARDASLAAIAVAACLEGLLPTVSPSKSPPDLQPIELVKGPTLRLTQGDAVLLQAGSPCQSGCQSIGLAAADHMDMLHGPHLRLPPQCHACQRSLTRKQSREPNVTAAVTATQSHPPPSTEHDLRLRKPTNARYDGFAGFS